MSASFLKGVEAVGAQKETSTVTSTILVAAMRSHWLLLGVGCGVVGLYLMIGAWQEFISSAAGNGSRVSG